MFFDKRAPINGRMMDVYDYDTYDQHRKEILDQNEDELAAVELVRKDGEKCILPIRYTPSRSEPGVYPTKYWDEIVYPDNDKERSIYEPDEKMIVDYHNIKNMQELLDKQSRTEAITNQILETPDNITKPPLKTGDTPMMRGVKLAVINKNMDIDKYRDRFGVNYPNDKRKLSDTDITLYMAQRFFKNLDVKADLVLQDMPGNIANPIGEGKKIVINIYPGNDDGSVGEVDQSQLFNVKNDDDDEEL